MGSPSLGTTAVQANLSRRLVTGRDWILAFSLGGNLLWLQWSAILDPVYEYCSPALIRPHVLALLLAMVFIPTVLAGTVAFIRTLPPLPQKLGRSLLVGLILAHPLALFAELLSTGISMRFTVPAFLLVDAAFVAFWREQLIDIGKTVLRVLFPVSILIVLLGLRTLIAAPGLETDQTEFQSNGAGDRNSNSIIWIVFDELDEDLAFDHYPQNRTLEEFERLREQSIFLNNAQAPNRATMRSIPALLTGNAVSKAKPVKGPDLRLDIEGAEQSVLLSTHSTVFDDAHHADRKVAVIGSYHPYCALFKHSIDDCYWTEWLGLDSWGRPVVAKTFLPIIRELEISVLPYMRIGSSQRRIAGRQFHRESVDRIVNATKAELRSGRCSFIFLHLPVPHPPFVFNSSADRYTDEGGSYWGNMVLADHILGELRRTLEERGVWDSATIIVTSDHHWRSTMWRGLPPAWSGWGPKDIPSTGERVPFMIKLPGQHSEFDYARHVNTLITRELIDYLLKNPEVKPPELIKLLDANRSRFDFPTRGPEE